MTRPGAIKSKKDPETLPTYICRMFDKTDTIVQPSNDKTRTIKCKKDPEAFPVHAACSCVTDQIDNRMQPSNDTTKCISA
jgi:hypothetical protein